MTIKLTFLTAIAIAGIAYLAGEALDRLFPGLRRYHVPAPILGGVGTAFLFWSLRAAGVQLEIPVNGRPVDFLVALLTTNMGLHVTSKVFRQGARPFLLFLGLGAVTYFVQLVLVTPIALFSELPLRSAIFLGPLTHVGLPYNLNPPSQLKPINEFFHPGFPHFNDAAKGMMMMGIIVGAIVTAVVSPRFVERAGKSAPSDSPDETKISADLWHFTVREVAVLVLVLTLITTAFGLQDLLLRYVPEFEDGYLPVIVISYLLGALFRLLFDLLFPKAFPKQALSALLFGPTMGIVLTYALLSIPLHTMQWLTLPMIVAGLLAIGGSLLVAWLAMPLFQRLVDGYYAAVISTIFLAVTTGFGPMAMSYLRRFSEENGPGKPVPVVLPLNAFFLFPWMVSLLTMLLLSNFG